MAADWVHINKTNGSPGTYHVFVTCDYNDSYYERSTTLTAKTVHLPTAYYTLTVIQAAKSSEFVLKDSTGALLKDKSGFYLIVKH